MHVASCNFSACMYCALVILQDFAELFENSASTLLYSANYFTSLRVCVKQSYIKNKDHTQRIRLLCKRQHVFLHNLCVMVALQLSIECYLNLLQLYLA